MKVLVLKEPWLQLIIEGRKTLESRWWSTPHRGQLALASAKTFDEEAVQKFYPDIAAAWPDLAGAWTLGPLGAIRCVVTVRNVRKSNGNALDEAGACCPCKGKFLWELTNVLAVKNPPPIRGLPGLFNCAWDVEELVTLGEPEG